MWYLGDTDIQLGNPGAYLDGYVVPTGPVVPPITLAFWSRLWTTIYLGFKTLRATTMHEHTLWIGDTKTLFFATGVDLSGSAAIKIKCTTPSGAVKEFLAAAETGTDPDGATAFGAVYTTQDYDLDEPGQWRAQVWDNVNGHSTPETFYVLSPPE